MLKSIMKSFVFLFTFFVTVFAQFNINYNTYTESNNSLDRYQTLALNDINSDGYLDIALGKNYYRDGGSQNHYNALYQCNNNGTGGFPGFIKIREDGPFNDEQMYYINMEFGKFISNIPRDLAIEQITAVKVHQGNGTTIMSQPFQEFAALGHFANIAIGNFDNNEWDDIAVSYDWWVTIYRNSGPPNYLQRFQDILTTNSHQPIKWVKLRNLKSEPNQKPRLLIGDGTDLEIYAVTDAGTLTLEYTIPLGFSSEMGEIEFADVDNDYDNDIFVTGRTAAVRLFINNNGYLSNTPLWIAPNIEACRNIAVADINKDNYPDIVAGGYYSTFKVYLNTKSSPYFSITDANQSLTTPHTISTNYLDDIQKIVLADIENKGGVSVVSCDPKERIIFTFKHYLTDPAPSAPRNLTVIKAGGNPKLKW